MVEHLRAAFILGRFYRLDADTILPMCLFASPKQWTCSIDIMKKETISSDTPYQMKDLIKPYDQ